MIERLSQTAINTALQALNKNCAAAWCIHEGKLYKEYTFADFVSAFGFMSKVALLAEKADHHPDWCNLYNTVQIALITHEVNGISIRDFALAESISALT